MRVGMVLHFMPALQHFCGKLPVLAQPASIQKKGHLHLLFIQNIQHRLNVLVPPGYINHEGYHRLGRIAPIDRVGSQVV
ncbi:hypothetical protein D3C80_1738220 [compost metagenome]